MKKSKKLLIICLLLISNILSNKLAAQNQSGILLNVGIKKYLLQLTDLNGQQANGPKGRLAPLFGVSYAHVLGKNISATYEFDLSTLKATYTEPQMLNPATEVTLKAPRTLSLRIVGHYRIIDQFFVSAGLGYDFLGFGIESADDSSDLSLELSDASRNASLITGIGYAADQFRVTLRHHAGLTNFIMSEDLRWHDTWRYDKLKIGQISLTLGYVFGAK